jgi:hypothetical protein
VTLSDRRLTVAAGLVLLLHLALIAAVEWAMFASVLTRAIGGIQSGGAPWIAVPVGRTITIELAAVVLSGAAAISVLGSGRRGANTARLASVFLIAWSPVVLYSAGILLALALGWEPGIHVFSSREATDAQVADTIREAMPIFMQPLRSGRHLANGTAMVLLAVLQYRLCSIDAARSIAAAAAAAIVITIAGTLQ